MNREPWPHAPPHWLFTPGIYFVTASAYHRHHRFDTLEKRQIVQETLIDSATTHGWSLRAWVILTNHYHILAKSPDTEASSLRTWLRDFHRQAAMEVNRLDGTPGRRVWMNFRESRITHQTSYLARLNYIHQNPVKHGLVAVADHYPWSSYRWFASNAPRSFVQSVGRFSLSRINVWDDF